MKQVYTKEEVRRVGKLYRNLQQLIMLIQLSDYPYHSSSDIVALTRKRELVHLPALVNHIHGSDRNKQFIIRSMRDNLAVWSGLLLLQESILALFTDVLIVHNNNLTNYPIVVRSTNHGQKRIAELNDDWDYEMIASHLKQGHQILVRDPHTKITLHTCVLLCEFEKMRI